MKWTPVRALALASVMLVGWSCSSPCKAWPWSKTVTVWEDDAHTGKIAVPKLDPDQIAKESTMRMAAGWSIAGVGASVGWKRQRGVKYDEKTKELIKQLKGLCSDFNRGTVSLESYRRRLREIYVAEEKARKARDQLFLLNRQEAQKAHVDLKKTFRSR